MLLCLSLVVMLVMSPPPHAGDRPGVVPALLVVSLRLRRPCSLSEWDVAGARRPGRRRGRRGRHRRARRQGVRPGGTRVRAGLADAAHELYHSRMRTARFNARYSSTLQAMPMLGQLGVLAVGGWLAFEGHITLGVFLAFASYLVQIITPRAAVRRHGRHDGSRPGPAPNASSSCSTPTPASPSAPTPALAVRPRRVEFDHVTFGYLRSDRCCTTSHCRS